MAPNSGRLCQAQAKQVEEGTWHSSRAESGLAPSRLRSHHRQGLTSSVMVSNAPHLHLLPLWALVACIASTYLHQKVERLDARGVQAMSNQLRSAARRGPCFREFSTCQADCSLHAGTEEDSPLQILRPGSSGGCGMACLIKPVHSQASQQS